MHVKIPSIDELLETARNYKWTPEALRNHVISFAWGNTHLHNPKITREDIEKAYDDLHKDDGMGG
jgi:hypothetical protein